MIGIGILVFNPFNDEKHLERIVTGINSFKRAFKYTKYKSKLIILLNESLVEHINLVGVGNRTKAIIEELVKDVKNIEIHSLSYNNSMVKGYNYLLKTLHQQREVKFLSVFADDYIVPINWIDTVISEFTIYKNADFLMPSTSYVTHKNLLVPFDELKSWNLDRRNGVKVGVKNGVKVEDIDNISSELQNINTIRYIPTPSFETTVFTRECIDKIGYLCEDYYFVFWNTEYFQRLMQKGTIGYISRKSFVFHYGKGGTTSLYNKTGDEKFEGSPVEKNLINDVNLYNKRNNKHTKYWWRKSIDSKETAITKEEIEKLLEFYNKKSRWYARLYGKILNYFKDLIPCKMKEYIKRIVNGKK